MSSKSAEAMKNTHDDAEKKPVELRPAEPGVIDYDSNLSHGEAALEEFLADSPKQLSRAFDGFDASARGDKALMGQYFDTKDYTSHSPLLRKYAEDGTVPSDRTLAERVHGLTGRR